MDPIHLIPNDDDAFFTPAEAEILERALVRGTPTEPTDEDFTALWRWARGVRFRASMLELLLEEKLVASIDPDGNVRCYAVRFFPRHGEPSNPPG